MTVSVFFLVALAGGVGAVARWGLDVLIESHHAGRFPLGIFVVNVTGSLLLGFVTAALSGDLAHILGIGALGGYTTFSTVSVGTVALAEDRLTGSAILNVVGTFIACVTAAFAGGALGGIVS